MSSINDQEEAAVADGWWSLSPAPLDAGKLTEK